MSTLWDVVFSQRPWGKYPGEEFIRFVARNFYGVPERSEITILELGCGTGSNLWYAAREGFTVLGFDISAVAVNQAKDRLDSEVPDWRGRVEVSDVRKIPVEDSAVDAVADNACVCCVDADSAREAYAEGARALKPGGKLFVRTLARGCWGDTGREFAECNAGPLKGLGPMRFTALEDIPSLLSGFNITRTELLTISYDDRAQTYREWVIHGTKKEDG